MISKYFIGLVASVMFLAFLGLFEDPLLLFMREIFVYFLAFFLRCSAFSTPCRCSCSNVLVLSSCFSASLSSAVASSAPSYSHSFLVGPFFFCVRRVGFLWMFLHFGFVFCPVFFCRLVVVLGGYVAC